MADVRLPEVVLLPFMCVPVLAAATFAGPRRTSILAVLAMVLGVVSGSANGDFRDDDYWYRLAATALVVVLAVYLADLTARREGNWSRASDAFG